MEMNMKEKIFTSLAVFRPEWENPKFTKVESKWKRREVRVSALLGVVVTFWRAPAQWQKFSTSPTAPVDIEDFFQPLKCLKLRAKPVAPKISSWFYTCFVSNFSKNTYLHLQKQFVAIFFLKNGRWWINGLKKFKTKRCSKHFLLFLKRFHFIFYCSSTSNLGKKY